MGAKFKNLKQDLKSNQMSVVDMMKKILREIDFVKDCNFEADNNDLLNQQNIFTGALGTYVHFVGHDTYEMLDDGLYKRSEIKLSRRLDENQNETQTLCDIYQTNYMDNRRFRSPSAARNLLVTVETSECLKQSQNIKETSFKGKDGLLLTVKHTAQENAINFINYLYRLVKHSIKNVVFERGDDNSAKILEYVAGRGR